MGVCYVAAYPSIADLDVCLLKCKRKTAIRLHAPHGIAFVRTVT
jgi:hypothetical protein